MKASTVAMALSGPPSARVLVEDAPLVRVFR